MILRSDYDNCLNLIDVVEKVKDLNYSKNVIPNFIPLESRISLVSCGSLDFGIRDSDLLSKSGSKTDFFQSRTCYWSFFFSYKKVSLKLATGPAIKIVGA